MKAVQALRAIQRAFRKGDFRITEHGAAEMTNDDISVADVINAILDADAEIVEDYPDDLRGPCCLIAGKDVNGEYIHLVVRHAPRAAIVTAYRLDLKRWLDHRTRRRP